MAAEIQQIINGKAPGTPTHLGTSGDDMIDGTSGVDVIDGLEGNDILRGDEGTDTYLYDLGSGNDRIEDLIGVRDQDVLRLIALNPADVTLARTGIDLEVRIVLSNETMTVKNQFDSNWEGFDSQIHRRDDLGSRDHPGPGDHHRHRRRRHARTELAC